MEAKKYTLDEIADSILCNCAGELLDIIKAKYIQNAIDDIGYTFDPESCNAITQLKSQVQYDCNTYKHEVNIEFGNKLNKIINDEHKIKISSYNVHYVGDDIAITNLKVFAV